MVLCFSPVGEKFQVRARQFPALVSCLTYDYFHTWPQEVWPPPSDTAKRATIEDELPCDKAPLCSSTC